MGGGGGEGIRHPSGLMAFFNMHVIDMFTAD